MREFIRIILFGVVSGLVWSLIPGTLSELWYSRGQTLTILLSGIVSGVLVSVLLAKPLRTVDWKLVPFFGLISLPLGGFFFGFTLSFVQLAAKSFTGASYRFVDYGFKPLETGGVYAIGGFYWFFPLILIPLAIITTWSLRKVIQRTSTTKKTIEN